MTTPNAVTSSLPQTSGDSNSSQIAELAAQINRPALDFEPGQYRKANVTAISTGSTGTPPTITVLLSGDTTVPIEGVRIASDYSPQIGDMVILAKQGSEFFALCAIAKEGSVTASSTAGGWTQATLNGAHAHNGNSNGNLMFRRVMEDGSWKMQWKGGITYGGGTTSVLGSALAAEYRPAAKQSTICARETASGGGVSIGVDFKTDGTIAIVGATWVNTASSGGGATSSASTSHSHSHNDLYGPIGEYNAGGTTSTDGGSHTHTYTHSHTAGDPDWIAFTGVEYFL